MSSNSGFTLLEVLISLSILSLILLSWETMQVITLRGVMSSYRYTVAVYAIDAMAERLIASKGRQFNQQITLWKNQTKEMLPSSNAEILHVRSDYLMTLSWGKNALSNCNFVKMNTSGCIRIIQHLPD